jgi:hypothetical protein
MAENKKRIPGFVGPSYVSRVHRFDCQRLINYYIELDETGGGKGQEPATLIGTPGLKFLQTLGTGPIRGLYTISNLDVAIVVSGNSVYQISGANAQPILLEGNLLTHEGPVSIADNGNQVVIVDGQYGYYQTIGETKIQQIISNNFYPAATVTFQDGYLIFNRVGTTQLFISDLYDVTFPALNLAAKTGNSDILMAVISVSRQLYVLGARTTEIWWDSGASGSTPFQRQDGRNSQIGCVAPQSVKILGETIFWLGSNAQGGGVVYTLSNAAPARVSTNAVEYYLQNIGDLSQATAYSYQQEGHYFYCLNIPGNDTTWVYDVSVGQWHERQSTVNGITGRNLAEGHCVLNNVHIVGDYRNGNIYMLDLETYTDNGNMIRRIRQSPHVSENLNNMFLRLMEVDFTFGVGLVQNNVNTPASVDPRVTLEISKDGGQTWMNPMYARIGKIGTYRTRARWPRCGYGRDLVLRVTVTEPVKVQMLSAFVDVEVGQA